MIGDVRQAIDDAAPSLEGTDVYLNDDGRIYRFTGDQPIADSLARMPRVAALVDALEQVLKAPKNGSVESSHAYAVLEHERVPTLEAESFRALNLRLQNAEDMTKAVEQELAAFRKEWATLTDSVLKAAPAADDGRLAAVQKILNDAARDDTDPDYRLYADLAKTADLLKEDAWGDDYIIDFVRHSLALMAANVFAPLPEALHVLRPGDPIALDLADIDDALAEVSSVDTKALLLPCGRTIQVPVASAGRHIMRDKDGHPFAGVRGRGSASERFYRWLGDVAPDLFNWTEGQAKDSWSRPSVEAKLFYACSRTKPLGDYYEYLGMLTNRFEQVPTNKGFPLPCFTVTAEHRRMYTAQHAFTYGLLTRTAIHRADPGARTLEVLRLETASYIDTLEPTLGEPVVIKRGPAESFSIVGTFRNVMERELVVTRQSIRYHRVFLTYLQARPTEPDAANDDEMRGVFPSEGEAEILAMADGIVPSYLGKDPDACNH